MDAKPSIIAHPAHTLVNVLREEYMGICSEAKHQHCCALLLNMFEHWTNYKWDEYWKAREAGESCPNLWIFNTQKAIQVELMELYGETIIAHSLSWLDGQGYIKRRFNPKKKNDRTLQYLLMTNRVQASVNGWAVSDKASKKVRTFAMGSKAYISPASRRNTTSSRKSTPTLPQTTSQGNASTKDSAAKDAAAQTPDENIPRDTQQKGGKAPDPWYDNILAVWNLHRGGNTDMRKFLEGRAVKKGWKEYNPPSGYALTDAEEICNLARWIRLNKLGGKQELTMLTSPGKLQSAIIEWVDAGRPTGEPTSYTNERLFT